MRHVKLALRTLVRTPFISAIAILSLALGIGANTAIFSIFDQVLRQPLPVQEPGRLVNLAAPGPKPGSQSCNNAGECDVVFSYAMYRDLERAQKALTGLAAHRVFDASISFRGNSMTGEAVLVSGSYFPTLGLRPALGRLFTPDDDESIGGHFVTVLSYECWQSRLGGDPRVLGEAITVNGHPLTIIGVAPRDFHGTTYGSRPPLYVPITMNGQMEAGFSNFENRRAYWVYVFGRLRPGATIDQARLTLNAIYRPIINDVEAPLQTGMSERTLAQFRQKEVVVEPGARGQSSVGTEARLVLIVLFGVTGIVLLIACANIANLLLARGANRSVEMAVRLSLGASRRQVVTQLLTESVILALIGGLASLLVAKWTLMGISSMMPDEAAGFIGTGMRPTIMAFAAALSIGTGLLFGLFPALHSTRPDLISTIRGGGGQASGSRASARFRTSLVTAQIALSMALLISAGLFIKSLSNASRLDLGVRVEDVITFRVAPIRSGYDSVQARALFDRLEEQLGNLPGVSGVTTSVVPLLAGSNSGASVRVEGFQADADTDTESRFNRVGEGYFQTLGIDLLAGREFTRADALGRPKVVIVNETFARKFNLGRDAVGKRIAVGSQSAELDMEIVGLVADSKYSQVKAEIPPLFFTPHRQSARVGSLSFYVRTASPSQHLRSVPGSVAALDPAIPIEGLKTMPQQVRESLVLDRMIGILAAAFSGLATLLAAVGLYGVLAYTVAQRTREFGVRMALGANSSRVRGLVLKQVGRMTVIGGIIGIAAALAAGRAAQSLLFGLTGHDPMVIVSAVVLLTLVGLLAAYIPAMRASRVDPMQALRYE